MPRSRFLGIGLPSRVGRSTHAGALLAHFSFRLACPRATSQRQRVRPLSLLSSGDPRQAETMPTVHRPRVRLLVVLAFAAAACSSVHHNTPRPSVPSAVVLGPRTFELETANLPTGMWLTVALHPSAMPVSVHVSPSDATQICPATLDGDIGPPAASWEPTRAFDKCRPPGRSGSVELPAPDGKSHVAFAIRSSASRPRLLEVQVSYSAVDSFVLVTAPRGSGVTASLTPQTRTVGVAVYGMPGYHAATATGTAVTVRQARRMIGRPESCDFGSEIGCVGPVTHGQTVTISVRDHDYGFVRIGVYLAWS